MSSNTNKLPSDEHQAMTEDQLQEKYKDHPSPLIQKLMGARREFLAMNGRFMTEEEVQAEIKEGRGASAWGE